MTCPICKTEFTPDTQKDKWIVIRESEKYGVEKEGYYPTCSRECYKKYYMELNGTERR